MKSHLHPQVLFAAGIALLFSAALHAEETTSTIAFSDPAKPGTVKISLGRGELRVQGSDTTDVTVKSEVKAVASRPRQDGLRVISASSGFSLTEKANVVTIEAAPQDVGRGSGFRLTVPRHTTVIVQNAWGGNITCSGISGDIEINSMHGTIRLDDVAGGVVVSTMNGEIRANVRELHEGKPLSFTSMNGEVVVRVPQAAKANVRLRTQNGSVLTDFDENALVTRTEATAGFSRGRSAFAFKGNRVITAEVEEAIREAARISATAVKEALEAVKEGLEAARLNSDEVRRELEAAHKEIDRARRDVEREPSAGATVKVPSAPKAPIPTVTGGKLVTGTLNGGGPEISVSTMNGDVILRKLDTTL